MDSGFFQLVDPGCIRLGGDDRRAFLQRQTSNHVDLLQPARSLLTVLTSPTARILDVLLVVEDAESLAALTLPGRGAATARYLRSRVFFMDKVTVADECDAVAQYEVFGPQAEAALSRLGLDFAESAGVATAGEIRGVRLDAAFGPGFRLVAAQHLVGDVVHGLAASGLRPFTQAEYAGMRVELGLATLSTRPGCEWSEDYTPLETGLRAAISDTKGCYTGQEIIARQITQDKVTRRLCGVRLSAPVAAGSELWSADGSPAGRLTSSAVSPRFGPIGLGVIRRPYEALGTELRVGDAGLGISALTAELPFGPV